MKNQRNVCKMLRGPIILALPIVHPFKERQTYSLHGSIIAISFNRSIETFFNSSGQVDFKSTNSSIGESVLYFTILIN